MFTWKSEWTKDKDFSLIADRWERSCEQVLTAISEATVQETFSEKEYLNLLWKVRMHVRSAIRTWFEYEEVDASL